MTDDIDFYPWPPRSERGGQHAGLYAGILAVHRETGLAVVCESERSQHGNRTRAVERLREVLALLPPARVTPEQIGSHEMVGDYDCERCGESMQHYLHTDRDTEHDDE